MAKKAKPTAKSIAKQKVEEAKVEFKIKKDQVRREINDVYKHKKVIVKKIFDEMVQQLLTTVFNEVEKFIDPYINHPVVQELYPLVKKCVIEKRVDIDLLMFFPYVRDIKNMCVNSINEWNDVKDGFKNKKFEEVVLHLQSICEKYDVPEVVMHALVLVMQLIDLKRQVERMFEPKFINAAAKQFLDNQIDMLIMYIDKILGRFSMFDLLVMGISAILAALKKESESLDSDIAAFEENKIAAQKFYNNLSEGVLKEINPSAFEEYKRMQTVVQDSLDERKKVIDGVLSSPKLTPSEKMAVLEGCEKIRSSAPFIVIDPNDLCGSDNEKQPIEQPICNPISPLNVIPETARIENLSNVPITWNVGVGDQVVYKQVVATNNNDGIKYLCPINGRVSHVNETVCSIESVVEVDEPEADFLEGVNDVADILNKRNSALDYLRLHSLFRLYPSLHVNSIKYKVPTPSLLESVKYGDKWNNTQTNVNDVFYGVREFKNSIVEKQSAIDKDYCDDISNISQSNNSLGEELQSKLNMGEGGTFDSSSVDTTTLGIDPPDTMAVMNEVFNIQNQLIIDVEQEYMNRDGVCVYCDPNASCRLVDFYIWMSGIILKDYQLGVNGICASKLYDTIHGFIDERLQMEGWNTNLIMDRISTYVSFDSEPSDDKIVVSVSRQDFLKTVRQGSSNSTASDNSITVELTDEMKRLFGDAAGSSVMYTPPKNDSTQTSQMLTRCDLLAKSINAITVQNLNLSKTQNDSLVAVVAVLCRWIDDERLTISHTNNANPGPDNNANIRLKTVSEINTLKNLNDEFLGYARIDVKDTIESLIPKDELLPYVFTDKTFNKNEFVYQIKQKEGVVYPGFAPVGQITENVLPGPQDDCYKLEYWLRYLGIASLVGLIPIYWATGMITPAGPVPLPVFYIPLAVIEISGSGPLVVGINICGMAICPLVLYVNASLQYTLPIIDVLNVIKEIVVMITDKTIDTAFKSLVDGLISPFIVAADEIIENARSMIEGYVSVIESLIEFNPDSINLSARSALENAVYPMFGKLKELLGTVAAPVFAIYDEYSGMITKAVELAVKLGELPPSALELDAMSVLKLLRKKSQDAIEGQKYKHLFDNVVLINPDYIKAVSDARKKVLEESRKYKAELEKQIMELHNQKRILENAARNMIVDVVAYPIFQPIVVAGEQIKKAKLVVELMLSLIDQLAAALKMLAITPDNMAFGPSFKKPVFVNNFTETSSGIADNAFIPAVMDALLSVFDAVEDAICLEMWTMPLSVGGIVDTVKNKETKPSAAGKGVKLASVMDTASIMKSLATFMHILTMKDNLPKYQNLVPWNLKWLLFLVSSFCPTGKNTYGLPTGP